MKKLIASSLVMVLCGCAGLYSGVVTITKVRDTAMKELAQLNKKGYISAETDKKIELADNNYRIAAELCAKSLEEYKASGGDKAKYIAALSAVKVAVTGILDILTPLVSQPTSTKLKAQLIEATQL